MFIAGSGCGGCGCGDDVLPLRVEWKVLPREHILHGVGGSSVKVTTWVRSRAMLTKHHRRDVGPQCQRSWGILLKCG